MYRVKEGKRKEGRKKDRKTRKGGREGRKGEKIRCYKIN